VIKISFRNKHYTQTTALVLY